MVKEKCDLTKVHAVILNINKTRTDREQLFDVAKVFGMKTVNGTLVNLPTQICLNFIGDILVAFDI